MKIYFNWLGTAIEVVKGDFIDGDLPENVIEEIKEDKWDPMKLTFVEKNNQRYFIRFKDIYWIEEA